MWDRLAPTLLPLPDHIGETPQGDLQDEGERPKHQGGRGDLSLEHVQRDVGMRLSRDVQAPDVPQLDQADPSGRDGERRDQSDEGEHPQHLRPVDLALGDADMPEGEQQDQVQREVADQRRDGERRPPLRYEPYRLVAEPGGGVPPVDCRLVEPLPDQRSHLPQPAADARARDFFHSIPAKSPMARSRTAMPMTVGTIKAAFVRPVMARAARAMMGIPSLMNVFQTPVMIVVKPISALLNPQDRYMV